jgi:hypothetical protein
MSNKTIVMGSKGGARKICNSGNFFRFEREYFKEAFFKEKLCFDLGSAVGFFP